MLDALFKLQTEATLAIAGFSFPAFSGTGESRNRRGHMCLPDKGPIPLGTYYILDRQSGGLLGPVYDYLKSDWFSLYAKDRVVDDQLYCAGLLRGQFRLHAKAGRGESRGCITLELESDFALLTRLLKSTKMEQIPGTQWLSYGTVVVS